VPKSKPAEPGVAFLLAQLGSHAAAAFAARIAPLDLTPPQAGVLRLLARSPGQSQRALADALGMHATRLVALIDDLESRDLVVRTRDPSDRRNYALALTDQGTAKLDALATVAREHERAITATLSADERRDLAAVLRRIAEAEGLASGVHPGFSRLGRRGP
jgi:DNA-binding MarR family transcriptional regulator